MKRIRVYVIVALVLSALIFIKAKFFTPEKTAKAGGKDKKKPAVPVSVFVVGANQLKNKVYANGTIVANEAAELKPEASGRIVYLNLPEGKKVEAGTLLLRLNDAEYVAQMAKIKSQLALAKDTETRQKKLLEVNGISKQDYDIAFSNLQSLKADSAYLQTQIEKTEIRAPFSGVIGIRSVSPGSYITPTVTAAIIHQIDPVKVEFSLPEKYSPFFKVGDEISFSTEGIADTFKGKILVKDPLVDLTSRSVRYRALTANPKGLLLPGAFARVELVINDNFNTLFVPTEAIVPIAKGKKIFTVNEGKAKEKIVETGIRTEDYVQILSGTEVGDSVVTNGNFQLKNNSAIKVVKGKGDKDKDKAGFKKGS